MNTGILYIVATPIGNLADITFRAIETLKKVDLIVCEDTRMTRRLLDHYEISTPAASFYKTGRGGSQKPLPKVEYFLEELQNGKNLAFVSDAGTPGISDPGRQIVEAAFQNDIRIVPIPGTSALGAIISVAGIDLVRFAFLGFPPHKKGRETFFREVGQFKIPVIYFESPHRLIKNLDLLKNLAPEKNVILGRELTKMFEEIVRGSVGEVLEYFQKNPEKVKGEIVVIAH